MTVSRSTKAVLFTVLVFLACVRVADAKIHDLTIEMDSRSSFAIETFGFAQEGTIKLNVENFAVFGPKGNIVKTGWGKAGFVIRRGETESDASANLELSQERGACLLDDPDNVFKLDLSDTTKWKALTFRQEISKPGLYSFIYARCGPDGGFTSFSLRAELYNPGPNYLSIGDANLPTLFMVFFVLFFAALVTWIVVCRRSKTNVHYIHYMMTMLCFFKMCTLLFESIKFHYMKTRGQPVGWHVMYYIFDFAKATILFVVILLIGTGWSLLKPFLSQREKKILMFVISLQVIDNVAMVVVDEMAPGSQSWNTWRDIFRIVDILCCCAILFPIVWSIRHLRQAAATDGKADRNLQKLTLFRHFYISVVSYIYFTRIVVLLLGATMPFQLLWLKQLFAETAHLAFYVSTGYRFRPVDNNPYLKVSTEDDDGGDHDENDDDFGLGDVEDGLGGGSPSAEMVIRKTDRQASLREEDRLEDDSPHSATL